MISTILAATAGAILFLACVAAVYAVARTGLATTDREPRSAPVCTGAWPRRRHYLWATLFFVVLAVYGSIVPLQFQPLGFFEAVGRYRDILSRSMVPHSRSNFVANVLLFMPIGYCLLAALATDGRHRVRAALWMPVVLVTCVCLSLAIEFAQIWLPARVPSGADVIAQSLGTVAGMGLWVVIGRTITDWIRSFATSRRPRQQIDWLLQAYCIGLLVYSVLPFDLTISLGQLARKYRHGRITLVPFSNWRADFDTFYAAFTGVAVFIPIGMLAATWMTSPGRPLRSRSAGVLLGGAVVAATELAQLLVYSRYTSTGDLILGALGVWIGVCLMHRWRGGDKRQELPSATGRLARHTWVWLAVACLYSVFVAVVLCAPFDLLDDRQEIKDRFEAFPGTVSTAYYSGKPFNHLGDVLKKLLLFAPLGAMLAWAVAPLSVPRSARRILLASLLAAAAGVAFSIEMAQVFLPAHVPSLTDVILYTASTAAGMVLALRIIDARVSPAESPATSERP